MVDILWAVAGNIVAGGMAYWLSGSLLAGIAFGALGAAFSLCDCEPPLCRALIAAIAFLAVARAFTVAIGACLAR